MTNKQEIERLEEAIRHPLDFDRDPDDPKLVGFKPRDSVIEFLKRHRMLLKAIDAGTHKIVPCEIKHGLTAMEICIRMQGKWNKKTPERDTEKVKRIYSEMLKAAPDYDWGEK